MTCLLILGPDMMKLHIDETLHPWVFYIYQGTIGCNPQQNSKDVW